MLTLVLVLVVVKLPNTLVLDLVLVIIYEICGSFVHKIYEIFMKYSLNP